MSTDSALWLALKAELDAVDGLVVAFSGGVDSSVLLAAAVDVLGPERTVAVIADSPSLARAELEEAQQVVQFLGVSVVYLSTQEFQDPRYVANQGDRCFWCKEQLFVLAGEEARRRGWTVAYGENADDIRAERPGSRSALQRGVLAPLRAAGWGKKEIRAFARERGLKVADKPASPCLASRVAVGIPVAVDILQRIEHLESELRAQGFEVVRARHLGMGKGRLEFGEGDWARAKEEEAALLDLARRHGYGQCTLAPYTSRNLAHLGGQES